MNLVIVLIKVANFDAIIAKKGKPRTFSDVLNLLNAAFAKEKEHWTLMAQNAPSDKIEQAWAELQSVWQKING